MKSKYLWTLLLTVTFFSCDDNTGSLGLSMLPESDMLNVARKTFDVTTKSVLSGTIFAKTSTGYVGKYTDPEFGYYETSFLTQLNCIDNLKLMDVYDPDKNNPANTTMMAGDSTYLTEVLFYYDNYFGDSLSACRMSVYQLDKLLDKNYYTDINPEDYYVEDSLLVQKAYTAYDTSVSDSIRALSSYYPNVRVVLPKRIGERILRLNREHPEYFANSDEFIKHVFKGLYVKTDYGDGSILYIDQVNLRVVFNVIRTDSFGVAIKYHDTGEDSTFYWQQTFAATKEVIQANRFENDPVKLKAKADETDWTYLKTPGGIFTEATLPIAQLAEELKNDTLNAVRLAFSGYHQDTDDQFSMAPPSTVMLIRENEVKEFFESNKVIDNVTSYASSYITTGSNANQYVFSNISNLISTCIAEKKAAQAEAGSSWNEAKWIEDTKWDKVLLVPVSITYDSSNEYIISVLHDMKPGYVKLKGGAANKLSLEVYYTYFQ